MSDTARFLLPRLGWTAVLTPVFYVLFGALGVSIGWVLAAVLAAVLVFGGFLIVAWSD